MTRNDDPVAARRAQDVVGSVSKLFCPLARSHFPATTPMDFKDALLTSSTDLLVVNLPLTPMSVEVGLPMSSHHLRRKLRRPRKTTRSGRLRLEMVIARSLARTSLEVLQILAKIGSCVVPVLLDLFAEEALLPKMIVLPPSPKTTRSPRA